MPCVGRFILLMLLIIVLLRLSSMSYIFLLIKMELRKAEMKYIHPAAIASYDPELMRQLASNDKPLSSSDSPTHSVDFFIKNTRPWQSDVKRSMQLIRVHARLRRDKHVETQRRRKEKPPKSRTNNAKALATVIPCPSSPSG